MYVMVAFTGGGTFPTGDATFLGRGAACRLRSQVFAVDDMAGSLLNVLHGGFYFLIRPKIPPPEKLSNRSYHHYNKFFNASSS